MPRLAQVAVLLEHPSGRVLLTRRSASLRSFPNTWVLPGGHWEAGESLRETGAREAFEETGVRVEAATLEPLALWESNYPIHISVREQNVLRSSCGGWAHTQNLLQRS